MLRLGTAAAAVAALSTVMIWNSAAEARRARGIPPFCVTEAGPRGRDIYAQYCEFYDYQQCLRAATGFRRNCVVNIDYPGTVVRVPGGYEARDPVQPRQRRNNRQ